MKSVSHLEEEKNPAVISEILKYAEINIIDIKAAQRKVDYKIEYYFTYNLNSCPIVTGYGYQILQSIFLCVIIKILQLNVSTAVR